MESSAQVNIFFEHLLILKSSANKISFILNKSVFFTNAIVALMGRHSYWNIFKAVVVVKWSVCLPSTPAEAYSFFCNIVFEKKESKQKEAGVGPLLKKTFSRHMLAPDCYPTH